MKTKTILITLIAMLTVTALVFQSCKKETNDEPPAGNKVPETTTVIENQIWQSNYTGIDSSDFTLYFDKKLLSEVALDTGDFIVSTEGYGLLRKVKKIIESADGLEIETEFARLTEVVNEGQTSFNSLLSTQKIMKIDYHKEGIVLDTSLMKNTEDTQLEYDIDVFLDPSEKIHIYGDFSILTELNGQLKIGYIPPRISLFELTYEIDQSLNLSADIELVNVNYEHEVDLVSVYFQPIIAVIAGVPVVLVPELEIAVGIEAEVYCDVFTGINQEMDYTVGLRYEEHEWTTISEFNKSFNYIPPQLDCNAGARAYIRPQFNILIYGVVSPYLYSDLFGKIESDMQNNPWWNLYAGADLGIGVEAEILGREIFDFNTDPPLISYEQLIASASVSDPPIASFYSNPTSGTAPLAVVFTDQSTNNPTSWQWEFGDGNSSSQQSPSHTYNTDGTYTVTLTVTNSYGSDIESKTDYIIVSDGSGNTPPAALFTVTPSSGTTSTNFTFDASGSTDPEDPTSELQVRWDFDGDGSWDTDWNTDKTENHQYSSEDTYTAKLEVKDTEGLTDQYTKSITVSNSPVDLSQNLLHYYPLNGDLLDVVGNNHFTNYGSIDAIGKIENGRKFNENTTGQFAQAASISLTSAASMSFWVYSFQDHPQSTGVLFKAYGSPHGDQSIFGCQAFENTLYLSAQGSSTGVGVHLEITHNEWHHVVLVFDGQNQIMKAFLDGTKTEIPTGFSTLYNPTSKIKMGMQKSAGRSFKGKLDEIGYWNRVLNDAEAAVLYNGGNGLAYPF